ncbi:MAG: glycosyltransferase [Methylococcaceae bacterium]|nr:glycosyltransferase [Methylococcaceae bacterium]
MDTRYALLTAAKNEEKDISHAIQSVIQQTIRPVAWFIVDDGSIDHTAEIIRQYAAHHSFIRLITREGGQTRSFGSKDKAINMAYELAKELSFSYIGVQDADIAVTRADYYEQVMTAFSSEPRLGIAGGYIYERKGENWLPRFANSPDSVAGGVQMFRRACFEQIGGYIPLPFGGEDWLAQIDALRTGWKVYALPELPAYHYRPTSSAGGRIRGLFRLGMMDASFGSHPLFELFKCAKRFGERPWILSSSVRLSGYVWWNLSRRRPLLHADKVAFLRDQQLKKVFCLLKFNHALFPKFLSIVKRFRMKTSL